MNTVYVPDASALAALFEGDRTMAKLWECVDRGETIVALAAGAVAGASEALRTTPSAWTALLWPRNVVDLPLEVHTAVTVGAGYGDVITGQVIHEAKAIMGTVITGEPDRYKPAVVPVLVI